MARSVQALAVLLVALLVSSICAHFRIAPLFFEAHDRGADFLKVILQLPGGDWPSDPFAHVVDRYANSMDYKGAFGILHLPPLSMVLSLFARASFTFVAPSIVFLALIAAVLTAILIVIYEQTKSVTWCLATAVSYPLLMMVDRGNLYAGLAAVCAIAALLPRKPNWTACVLFAIAINVRPNLALCALPLIFLEPRFAFRLAILTGLVFGGSLIAAQAIYPTYTLMSFLAGVESYTGAYAAGGLGVPFGSSLYGAFYALGWPASWGAAMAPLTILPLALFAFHRGWIDYGQLVFICAALMGLLTTIFGDYHLLIFIAPLVLARDQATFWASLLLLAPKAFGTVDSYSIQVILNPAIMLAGVGWILMRSYVNHRAGPATIPATQ